jgi:transposase
MYLQDLHPKFNLLIDSTGLENAIKIPITAINKHNGIISNEMRLLVVADKISGLPLFYRYVPGNIVDVSTLINIINEIKEYNININRAILGAGYYSDANIKFLIGSNILFMTRLSEKTEIYNLLIKNFIIVLTRQENRI